MRSSLALILFLSLNAVGFSATYYVPDNFSSIQSAVDAAASGDTIIVRPGIYFENVIIHAKGLTLESEAGPLATWIDGGQDGRVVTMYDNGADPIRLEGFTIMNGYSGGIACGGGTAVISNNRIMWNSVKATHSGGGGIACSGPTIDTFVEITNNTIAHNDMKVDPFGNGGSGGGIRCERCVTVSITDNLIENNWAVMAGGGIFLRYVDNSVIARNVIRHNWAVFTGSGGGGVGGGIYSYDCVPRIENNQLISNHCSEAGGGICCSAAQGAELINNTIVGNISRSEGGGLVLGETQIEMWNTILWGNEANWRGKEISCTYSSILSINYSDVEGGQSGIYVDGSSVLNMGQGVIDADPLLATSENDGHITYNSPCRDSGSNSAPGLPTEDFENDPRLVSGTVDMGADEFHGHLYHVGDATPGAAVTVRVVGTPGEPVLLALGGGIEDPPLSTQYGDLYLTLPLTNYWHLGTLPGNGLLLWPITIPASGDPWGTYPSQALVGPWGDPNSRLTNLHIVKTD